MTVVKTGVKTVKTGTQTGTQTVVKKTYGERFFPRKYDKPW